jgi:predicted MFS family arabinose efflux permease
LSSDLQSIDLATTSLDPSRRHTLAVLGLSTGVHTLATLQVFTVPAIAPAMAAGIGVSESLVGVQVILVYTAAMITSLFAGSVVVRIGALRATQISVLGAAIGLGFAAIPSIAVVVVASLLLGASYGLVNPATGQLLESGAPPARRALLFSIKQAAIPLGGILAGVIAPLLAVSVGWQGALLTVAAASVVVALLVGTKRRWFPFQRRHTDKAGPRLLGDVGVIWTVPALRYMCLAAALFAGVQLSLTTYIVTLLVEHVGIGLIAAGIGLSFFNAGGICGRFCWGFVSDAIGSGLVVLAGVFGIALVLLGVFPFVKAAWSIPLIYVFVTVLGFMGAGTAGVVLGEVLRLSPPDESARAIAGAYAFTFAGALSGVGCFVLGFQHLGNYNTTTWVLTAMASGGFLLSLNALAIARRGGHAATSSRGR